MLTISFTFHSGDQVLLYQKANEKMSRWTKLKNIGIVIIVTCYGLPPLLLFTYRLYSIELSDEHYKLLFPLTYDLIFILTYRVITITLTFQISILCENTDSICCYDYYPVC